MSVWPLLEGGSYIDMHVAHPYVEWVTLRPRLYLVDDVVGLSDTRDCGKRSCELPRPLNLEDVGATLACRYAQ